MGRAGQPGRRETPTACTADPALKASEDKPEPGLTDKRRPGSTNWKEVSQMDTITTTDTTPGVACDQCGGRLIYRVKFEDFAAGADNFDQLVDHRPALFTSREWLRSVATGRDGQVTVWRLADADDGGDWTEDTVIAYAGPHPSANVPGRTWVLDLSGHGFFDELEDAECEGHESLAGEHMGETVFCDGSCQAVSL